MSTLVYLHLLLAAFSTFVSSQSTHSLTAPAVYNNCSGNNPVSPPSGAASTPFFKPQICVKPLEINKNGTGWEEWLFLSHNRLADGSELIYSYKWALGDPISANVSHHAFTAWAYFPNGTFYHQAVYDSFKYRENADGGFTYSIANNHLTWDPVYGFWNTSVNAGGWIIDTHTENVEPGVPFAPNYKSIPGQISEGFFSRIDVPRGHTDGYMVFPWGLNYTVQSVGSLKHTWSKKVMADALSAYVRGSTFLPNIPPIPVATVSWYQAWDPSGKEVDSMQLLLQPDNTSDGQVFRLQVTDASGILTAVTTPKPVSLPLSYESTELALPMCGPGAHFRHADQKMKWKTTGVRHVHDFVDLAGGVTLYQSINITGVVWVNGTSREVAGGIGIVEVYHR